MTRAKWYRLRRERPELFMGVAFTWEKLSWTVRRRLMKVSKPEAIATLTAFQIAKPPGPLEAQNYFRMLEGLHMLEPRQ